MANISLLIVKSKGLRFASPDFWNQFFYSTIPSAKYILQSVKSDVNNNINRHLLTNTRNGQTVWNLGQKCFLLDLTAKEASHVQRNFRQHFRCQWISIRACLDNGLSIWSRDRGEGGAIATHLFLQYCFQVDQRLRNLHYSYIYQDLALPPPPPPPTFKLNPWPLWYTNKAYSSQPLWRAHY